MSPRRIQLKRTKGWRKPEGAVVVSRPSRWGNPYAAAMYHADYPDASDRETRRMAVADFRGLVYGLWDLDPEDYDGDKSDYPSLAEIRGELRGRDLACWCPLNQPCHADVLLDVANS